MNSSLVRVTATFSDGTTEELPTPLVKRLARHSGDHATFAGLIEELYHDWDKTYALKRQEDDYLSQIVTLQDELAKKHQDGLNKQKGKDLGVLWDKWAETLPGFPYHPHDVIPIGQPGDRICFRGMVEDNIQEVIWLEYQIKNGVYEKRKKQIKSCLDNGKFRYELYIPPKHWIV